MQGASDMGVPSGPKTQGTPYRGLWKIDATSRCEGHPIRQGARSHTKRQVAAIDFQARAALRTLREVDTAAAYLHDGVPLRYRGASTLGAAWVRPATFVLAPARAFDEPRPSSENIT